MTFFCYMVVCMLSLVVRVVAMDGSLCCYWNLSYTSGARISGMTASIGLALSEPFQYSDAKS